MGDGRNKQGRLCEERKNGYSKANLPTADQKNSMKLLNQAAALTPKVAWKSNNPNAFILAS